MAEHDQIFRKEALDYQAGAQGQGTVLRLSPSWTRWAFWLLLAVVGFYVMFGIFGWVSQYATGPAVVRMVDRLEVTALSAGQVTSVEVQPGQRVKEGQILARFFAGPEQASLERYEHEFELLLLQRMRDLTNEAADQSLTSLRAEMELAKFQLEQRLVRAPQAGVVSDVRVRRGQHLSEGEVVVALVQEDSPMEVIAMLPGGSRPLLAKGGKMRLELEGFQYQYQELIIDQVGDGLVGPEEVRRYLGPELADSLTVNGAVVLVRAHAPSRFFEADGKRLTYFDGMQGTVDARVKSERIILTIIPGLKVLFH
ncbi:efflux RND transporter periplasmic adaptor subunit [Cystobacter ferrugineus]|uniref:Hemolysin D n=1 Tax=Cystobacter ferrugineus TaxID=83449 RepID=A0A1L9B0Y7_9BACT|nr:HlyD family efflux transporter periplasmic adaptor subunit [Cystobacter ferrugineus]OJH35927.1 hemolysin D [Cystobacter ferrugineus]